MRERHYWYAGAVIIIIGLLYSAIASAQQANNITLRWTSSSAKCDGSAVAPAEIQDVEIYLSTSPLNVTGTCQNPYTGAPPDPNAPGTSVISVTLTPGQTSYDYYLPPGVTYYGTMRMGSNSTGLFSQFTPDSTHTVTASPPNLPTLQIFDLGD